MKMTPTSMMTVRNIRKIKDILQVGGFLITSFHLTPQVLYIFRNLRQDHVEGRLPQPSGPWSRISGTSRRSRMSSKYEEFLCNHLALNTLSTIHFWKPQANSSLIKMTSTIILTARNFSCLKD